MLSWWRLPPPPPLTHLSAHPPLPQAAVVGVTVRHDVVEMLEKRVKSRFRCVDSCRCGKFSLTVVHDSVAWLCMPDPTLLARFNQRPSNIALGST